MTSIRGRRTAVSLVALAAVLVAFPAQASEEVLQLERQESAQGCTDVEFLDGFTTEVDANGDELPDYLINTQRLMCDGSQMMWCGTMGCAHRIWVQRPDGGFDKALDSYAYEIVFDRPGDTSFKVVTREGTSRQSLADQADGRAAAAPVVRVVSMERWSYRADPVPVAAIGGQDSILSLACENGSARIRYTAHWMFENGELNDFIREWNVSPGIVATFDVAGNETDVPMQLSDAEGALVARSTVSFGAPVLDDLARGSRLTIHHGGSIEHELQFALKGSSAALASLRAACM